MAPSSEKWLQSSLDNGFKFGDLENHMIDVSSKSNEIDEIGEKPDLPLVGHFGRFSTIVSSSKIRPDTMVT